MDGLGDLLEILDRAGGGTPRLVAEYREWQSARPSAGVMRGGRGTLAVQLRSSGKLAPESQTCRQIWVERSDRLRVELHRSGALVRMGVRDGPLWWRWDEAAGTSSGVVRVDGTTPPMPPMLDPVFLDTTRLIPLLRFECVGTSTRAGRDTRVVLARPRRPDGFPADAHYEFEFDLIHGIILRVAAFEAGQCVRTAEAVYAKFGCDIEPARFQFVPPDGREAAPANVLQRHDLGRDPGPTERFAGTLWLTGLPASAKKTLAVAIEHELRTLGRRSCLLDADVLRGGLNSDLGSSRVDQAERSRRAAHAAALVARSGGVAIVATDSPYKEDRARAREIHAHDQVRFWEIWVDVHVRDCEDRGPTGPHLAARLGCRGRPRIDSHYEPPDAPDLTVRGSLEPARTARRVVGLMVRGDHSPLSSNADKLTG